MQMATLSEYGDRYITIAIDMANRIEILPSASGIANRPLTVHSYLLILNIVWLLLGQLAKSTGVLFIMCTMIIKMLGVFVEN